MKEDQADLLTESILENTKRRKQLLPLWIKIFTWIFLIFGTIIPFALVLGILGFSFDVALYGLEAKQSKGFI